MENLPLSSFTCVPFPTFCRFSSKGEVNEKVDEGILTFALPLFLLTCIFDIVELIIFALPSYAGSALKEKNDTSDLRLLLLQLVVVFFHYNVLLLLLMYVTPFTLRSTNIYTFLY